MAFNWKGALKRCANLVWVLKVSLTVFVGEATLNAAHNCVDVSGIINRHKVDQMKVAEKQRMEICLHFFFIIES